MSAPASKNQPSRKTKKAWRKNIDLAEISSGLDSARHESIITGGRGLLVDVPAETLFQTDTAGDVGIQRQVRRDHGDLKVDEIIAQRSAVPAVSSKKRSSIGSVGDGMITKKQKTGAGLSKKEYERLRTLAYGGSSTNIAQTAASESAIYDPWDEPPQPAQKPNESYLDASQPVQAPRTLRQAPIPLTASGKPVPNVRRPSAHKSYQPVATDWLRALESEGAKAVAVEKARLQAAEKEADRLARIHASAEEADKQQELGMSEYESEWEGIQSDIEEAALKKKRPQRKTPAERNKILRRKEAERQSRHDARMKQRDEQASKILAIRKEVEAREAARDSTLEIVKSSKNPGSVVSEDESEDEQIRKRRFGERAIPEQRLELVLPDELEETLRRLKPEGNLLDERFRNMIVQGKIEARPKPIGQQKQKKVKVTEKWQYKDWKLR